MCRPLWIAAAAAVVLSADFAPAQLVITPVQARFGRQTSIFIQPRVVPMTGFAYFASGYGFGPAPLLAVPQVWAYGGGYLPQPPIIINNFIQSTPPIPIVAGPIRERGVPPEFEPAAPPPRPAARAKVPAAPPPGRVEVEEPPRRALGRADADRIAEAGRRAFADGQYGRALELFRKEVEITPNEPSAHYQVSQALFALGKYREAVNAIAMGIALRADWSEARFKSRDLYWKKPAAFDEHLAALQAAVAAFPDDPALTFLLGHQLWFDGKPEEARPFILKARALNKGQTPAEAFRVEAR